MAQVQKQGLANILQNQFRFEGQAGAPRFAAPASAAPQPYQGQTRQNPGMGAGEIARPEFSTNHLANVAYGGQGKNFTVYRGAQALDALRSGATDAEAGDYQNREALRQALGQQIGQYGGAADQREQNFLANQERGLSRNVAQLRRQMGGTGLQGSSQGNRSLGEVLAGAQRETGQGLNQLQLQKGQELSQLAGANQANLAQTLAERGFTLDQAKSLSELLQQQAMMEQNSILGSATQAGPSQLERGIGYATQLGGALGGAMIMKSDERLKTNIIPGEEELSEFLDSLGVHSYEYRNKEYGAGRYVSVMAQELEKTELGKDLVIDTAAGKVVDYAKGFGVMLAANAMLYKEIQELKEAVRGKTV